MKIRERSEHRDGSGRGRKMDVSLSFNEIYMD